MLHDPFEQVSVPLQKIPSLHGLPFGSGPVHPPAASLHDSAQFESPSAPGHWTPECCVQNPVALQLSAPLQNRPSLHGDPWASRSQPAEQQSPPAVLPSSHCSPISTT